LEESRAKTDVVVRVRALVVQVQRGQAGFAGVVAVAATTRETFKAFALDFLNS